MWGEVGLLGAGVKAESSMGWVRVLDGWSRA